MEHFKQRVLDKVDEQIMDLENLKNCINDCEDERALLNALDEFFIIMKVDDAHRNVTMATLYNYCKFRFENRKGDNND